MSRQPYPDYVDCIWIASDHLGQIAAFITAGQGPIPIEALDEGLMNIKAIEPRLADLPKVAKATLIVKPIRPDSYIEIAERGFFTFDWTDEYQTPDGMIGTYQLVSTPSEILKVDELPTDLRASASHVSFDDFTFDNISRHINVRRLKTCAESIYFSDERGN